MASSPAPDPKPVESVWDYPRPPRLEHVDWRIRVEHAGTSVVDAPRALRVLETSQAPAYYVALEFVNADLLRANDRRTFCEWKGVAHYADLVIGEQVLEAVCWSYPDPVPAYAALVGHWAFYSQRVDACWVDDERVVPNDGGFYGGWITSNLRGPIKGAPGTLHW